MDLHIILLKTEEFPFSH